MLRTGPRHPLGWAAPCGFGDLVCRGTWIQVATFSVPGGEPNGGGETLVSRWGQARPSQCCGLLEAMLIDVMCFGPHARARIRGDRPLATWGASWGGSRLYFHAGDTSSGDSALITW